MNTVPLTHLSSDNQQESNVSLIDKAGATLVQGKNQFGVLSQVLRVAGAAMVVAAMAIFLLQGWEAGSDLSRYVIILCQALLLGGAGVALAFVLKENKGARVFFGLSLVAIPVNFAVLGAMLFSQFDLAMFFNTATIGDYPEYATWQAQDIGLLTLAVLGALVSLTPLALFAFAIFDRTNAKALTFALIASSALLLLPIRIPLVVSVIAIANAIILWRIYAKREFKNTLETRIARILTYIPAGVILGRAVVFYELDSSVALLASLALYTVVRELRKLLTLWSAAISVIDIASALSAFGMASLLTSIVASMNILADTYLPVVFLIGMGAIIHEVFTRNLNHFVRIIATVFLSLALTAITISTLIFLDSAMTVFCMAILAIAFGKFHRSATILALGIIMIGASIVFITPNLFTMFDINSWVLFGTIGSAAVIIASLVERYGSALLAKVKEHSAVLKTDYRF